MGFLSRRLVTAALTANAIRTLPEPHVAAGSFLPGWVVGEFAPQLLALTVADTAVAALRGRAGRPGLTVAGVTVAGLGYLTWQARGSHRVLDAALADGLGADYVEQLDAVPGPADYATPWRSLARPFHWARPDVEVVRDLRYSDAGRRGLLDLYRPTQAPPSGAPVLLHVHGGGWVIGSKEQQGVPLSLHMAARGWVVVSINYRLAPRDAFPAQIIDVKRAIAWIREHIGEYGGDPDYLAVTGGSAGGHLTALAALTPNDPDLQPGFESVDTRVQAAVPHYGVYDLAGVSGLASAVQTRDVFFAPRVMQTPYAADPARFEKASPITHVSAEAPDFFVIHGDRDSLVDVEQGRRFVRALRAVSRNRVVYAELPGAQHAFDIFYSIRSAQVVTAVDRFLTWHWNTHRHPTVADAVLAGGAEGVAS